MISRWLHIKSRAISLRKKGYSIRDVENELGIPRSTLSGWFKDVKLNKKHQKILKHRWDKALITARKRAVVWHNEQKRLRLKKAEQDADEIIQRIDFGNRDIVELALAMLYLGEGTKNTCTGMGNSDPIILKFFLKIMLNLYPLDIDKIRFDLHLRYDQDPDAMKRFWATELDVPLERFKHVSKDSRTKGRKTYQTYKGVCYIDCSNVAIQRKLVYLSKKFCQKIITNNMRD